MTTTNEQEVQRKELPVDVDLFEMLIRLREVKDEKARYSAEESELIEKVKAVLADGQYTNAEIGLDVTLTQAKSSKVFNKEKFKTALNGLRFPCRHCKGELGIPASATSEAEASATSTRQGNRPLTVNRIGESEPKDNGNV